MQHHRKPKQLVLPVELDVACPVCSAPDGKYCVIGASRIPWPWPHQKRRELAMSRLPS